MFMGKAKEREQFGDSTEVGSVVKEFTCNAGDPNLIPESGRSLGGGHNNPSVFLPGESYGQRSLVVYGP